MDGIKKSTAAVILFLIVVACGSPTDTDPTASIGTVSSTSKTVTIAGDSEWQIPSGFNVVLPLTYDQIVAMLANDVGVPPDIPDFTMTREATASEVQDRVVIAVYSDGVSAEADPMEVLTSWTETIAGAEYGAFVTVDRVGLHMATWRGQAHSLDQESPQGIIAAVISHPETQKVWRLWCFVTSEGVSDEVARICDQVQAEFRPL